MHRALFSPPLRRARHLYHLIRLHTTHPDLLYPDSRRFPPARQITNAKKNDITLGVFLFGTDRVGEFLEKGFNFISIGNDLHHIQTVPPRPPHSATHPSTLHHTPTY